MSRTVIITEKCPQCGMLLGVRFNRANSEPFIGCMAYPTCRFTEPYIERTQRAAVRINELQERVEKYERRYGKLEDEPQILPPAPPPAVSRSLIDQTIKDLFPNPPERPALPPVTQAPAAPRIEIDFGRRARRQENREEMMQRARNFGVLEPPRAILPPDVPAPRPERSTAERFLAAAREAAIELGLEDPPSREDDDTITDGPRDRRELDLD